MEWSDISEQLSSVCSGRKKAALAYVLTYTSGCVTKHFNDFNVLFVGRLFSGVATSLLYSAFESWLVAEHKKVGLLTPRKTQASLQVGLQSRK